MDPVGAIAFLVTLALWGGLMLLVALWSRAASNALPKYRIAEYVPPEGDIIMHGLLARANRRVIGAAIIGMAVKGQVRVLAPRGQRGPVALEAMLGNGLSSQERMLLNCFRPSTPTPKQARKYAAGIAELGISVSDPNNAPDIFFLKGPAVDKKYQRRQLTRYFDTSRQVLKQAGLARKVQNGVFLGVLSLMFLIGVIAVALLALGAAVNGDWWFTIIAPLFLVGYFFILYLAAPPILRFTPQGNEIRRHLSGLREYVRLGELERLRMTEAPDTALRTPVGQLTPAGLALGLPAQPQAPNPAAQAGLDRIVLTEQLLPYAVLFGQERQWAREFSSFDAGVQQQNLSAVATTMEGVVMTLEVLVIIGKVLQLLGAIASLGGRSD